MTTTMPISWAITAIDTPPTATPHRCGRAASRAAAFTAALRAGRALLLAGELDTLAVTIDDHREAWYSPARDHHGHIDPRQLITGLLDLHQAGAAGELADQLSEPDDGAR